MGKIDWVVLPVEEVEEYKKVGYEPQKVPCWALYRMGFMNLFPLREGDVLRLCFEYSPDSRHPDRRCTIVEIALPCPRKVKATRVPPCE